MAPSTDLEAVVAAVLSSRKYRAIDPDLVRAVATGELAKGRRPKAAIKATKNQLHRSAAVYQAASMDLTGWLDLLQAKYPAASLERRRELVRPMLSAHVSTRERLSFLDAFYSRIFAHLPPIRSLIDIACGLNPLCLAWMPLAPGASYVAYDIYADQIAFLDRFLALAGIDGGAEVRDVVHAPPGGPADLALVLKAIPCLEQIEKDAGERLLENLDATHWVISFPVQSLGGRERGMEEHYAQRFHALMAGNGRNWVELTFETELVYVVSPGSDEP